MYFVAAQTSPRRHAPHDELNPGDTWPVRDQQVWDLAVATVLAQDRVNMNGPWIAHVVLPIWR